MPNHARAQDYRSSTPVRIWGDISTLYRTREFDGGDSRATQNLNTGSINASSYIWQPWFALVSGGFTLAEDTSDSTGQQSVKNNFVTGRFNFNLFPRSRFPFQFNYNQSRNTLDNNFFEREVVTEEYSVAQQYSSINGNNRYRAKFRQNQREEKGADTTDFESLFFSSSHQFTSQSINADIQIDSVENELQDEMAEIYSLTGRHSYTGSANFSLENLVSKSKVENSFLQSESDSDTAQVSSLMSWQPQGRDDLSLTGGFRFTDIEVNRSQTTVNNVTGENSNESSTANINQGLVYSYSDRVIISQSANASLVETGDQEEFSASESVAISYSSDIYRLDAGDYGFTLGSAFSNQHGDAESSQSFNNRFSHSLSSDFSVRDSYQLRTNLTQSLSQNIQSNQDDDTKRADHAFSITWSESSASDQSLIRFSVSDSRTLDDTNSSYQLINLQYSGFIRFNRYAQLTGNITLQKSRQVNEDNQSETIVRNGQLEFLRDRLFQIHRLRFRSRLKLSEQQSENDRFIANLNSDTNSEASFENSLQYRIGRLEAQMSLDYIKIDDEVDRLFKIQLTRSFGDL